MVSFPQFLEKTYVSFPSSPYNSSFPVPPFNMSLPIPPNNLSSPLSPFIISSPFLPCISSFPFPAFNISFSLVKYKLSASSLPFKGDKFNISSLLNFVPSAKVILCIIPSPKSLIKQKAFCTVMLSFSPFSFVT